MNIRKKSPLAIYESLSPNCTTPRNKIIRRLTPHCVAGNLSMETTLNLSTFKNYNSKNGASCSYAIGSDGRIGLGVSEENRPWTSSSSINDHQAITFEISNIGGAPDWRMSDEAINSWMNLAVEICEYYGYRKINYQTKPESVTGSTAIEKWLASWMKDDEMIVTLHRWYANKACPGEYFIRQIPWIVKEINKRLGGMSPEKFIGEGVVPPIHIPTAPVVPPPSTNNSVPYMIRITAKALNLRKGPGTNTGVIRTLVRDPNVYTIVEEAFGPGASKWGKLKSGSGWLSLDYVVKVK